MPQARHAVVLLGAAAVLAAAVGPPASAATPLVEPYPGMVITTDTTLRPGVYEFTSGDGIVVAADGVTVDGTGVTLRGPGVVGDPDSFVGTGVSAKGVSGATLTGLAVTGFETALHVESGRHWRIEGNTFSRNYTDPDFGWGDGKLAGAVLLEHVSDSTIRGTPRTRTGTDSRSTTPPTMSYATTTSRTAPTSA